MRPPFHSLASPGQGPWLAKHSHRLGGFLAEWVPNFAKNGYRIVGLCLLATTITVTPAQAGGFCHDWFRILKMRATGHGPSTSLRSQLARARGAAAADIEAVVASLSQREALDLNRQMAAIPDLETIALPELIAAARRAVAHSQEERLRY